ncbi:MAG: LLM class flavin-dependent oxidoreductase, partial [Dehalococcoidia bacterium]|nr:LLM class flavin-dependent oxidoreductase [Dehalococcoidia bacterium]
TLKGGRLAIRPAPETPTYLGALGPEMLRLAGEMADGACLNWCDASQISWSRERIAEGAARSGRDPAEIKVAEYIRVCIDDDEDKARLAYAQSTMGYALGAQIPTEREKQLSYRGHFERMGFSEELARLDDMRRNGASRDAVAEAFDPDLLKQVGYYGRADGAAAALKDLSQGLDFSIVRVVASRPGVEAVLETLRACQPKLVLG